MSTIFPVSRRPTFAISEHHSDLEKAETFLSLVANQRTPLVKQASANSETAIALLQALAGLDLKVNIDLGELIRKIQAGDNGLEKYAGAASREKRIVVASKALRDSHYQFDVTQDSVVNDGKRLILVAAYLRDAYLGRYLIKRNFYFTADNKKDADAVYDETITRFERIKARYHEDRIPVNGIFAETKAYLDGVRADITFNGDQKGG